nr:MAG TPA: hypothetical protein [Caudoviricetes sp.]
MSAQRKHLQISYKELYHGRHHRYLSRKQKY